MDKRTLDLDQIIAISMEREALEISTPPKDEVWPLIARELAREQDVNRKNRWIRKLAVASGVLILSLGALPLLLPGEVSAVGQRLIQIYRGVVDGSVRIDTISRDNPPPPNAPSAPPEDQPPVEVLQVPRPKVFSTLVEARKIVPYAFLEPKYVPRGYKLVDITFTAFENESGEVALRYKSAKAEFAVRELEMAGKFAMSSNIFDQEANIREVKINGARGTLVLYSNGFNELEYYSMGIAFRVHGIIAIEEILKIAKSLN